MDATRRSCRGLLWLLPASLAFGVTACDRGQPAAPPAAASGQPAPRDTPAPTGAGPRISFATTAYDLGTIPDSDAPRLEFEFTNTGDGVLRIQAVKPSCGCVTASARATEIEPGASSAIVMTFTPEVPGDQRKRIDVVTNAEGESIVRLSFRADVKASLAFDPPGVQFTTVPIGRAHRRIVSVSALGSEIAFDALEPAIATGGLDGPRGYLQARLVEGSTARAPQIEVTLTEDAPWGISYGEVAVTARLRPDGGGPEIRLRTKLGIAATVYGELRSDQYDFKVGALEEGATFQQSLQLWRTSREPFKIIGTEVVTSPLPGLEVGAFPLPQGVNGYLIVLTGETGDYYGVFDGRVAIRTDVPGEDEIEFRFKGMVE